MVILEKGFRLLRGVEPRTARVTAYIQRQPRVRNLVSAVFGVESLPELQSRKLLVRLLLSCTVIMSVGVLFGHFVMGHVGWIYREGKPMTWLSFIFLLTVAFLAQHTAEARRSAATLDPTHPAAVWWFLSWGFYLAAWDELLRLHETVDHQIHKVLGMKPTSLTDHLDDAFVVVYGIVGLMILWHYRSEVLRYMSPRSYFYGAVVFGFISVLFDFISSSKPLLRIYFPEPNALQLWIEGLDVFEEWMKIYAEIFFLGAAAALYVECARSREG